MRQLLALPAAVLLLAACGPGTAGQGGATGGTSGTAPPARTGDVSPRPSPIGTGCTAAPDTISARRGELPAAVCLTPGATVRIVTDASPQQPWAALASSNEAVVRCRSRRAAEGAIEAACTALTPGTVTVSTTTAPFAGDPHGPPQYLWRLRISVLAR